jgi:sister chromatid cohesion protein DCC1
MRSVNLSNSILVVTSPEDDFPEETVVIQDQVNEIIELAPAVPKLQKLTSLLRGREYDDNEEAMEEAGNDGIVVSQGFLKLTGYENLYCLFS